MAAGQRHRLTAMAAARAALPPVLTSPQQA
jgi:hypothetical protein